MVKQQNVDIIDIVCSVVCMLFCGYVCTRAIEAALKLDIMFYAVMSLVFFILTVLCATLLTYDIYKLNQKGEIT